MKDYTKILVCLIVSLLLHSYLYWQMLGVQAATALQQTQLQSITSNFVTTTTYNQLVRFANTNSVVVSGLNTRQKAQGAQLQQLASLTNLFIKIEELEAKSSEGDIATRTFEQHQALAQAKLNSKFEALERAIVKLSLAVQENQFKPVMQAMPKSNIKDTDAPVRNDLPTAEQIKQLLNQGPNLQPAESIDAGSSIPNKNP